MLSFMYRFGSELWDGGCGDGRKMRGELRYMKEILLGFGYLYGFWFESERECEEGCCYEFKGRAVVVGKGGFVVEEGLSSEEVSDAPPTIVGGWLSDYEVTESAMNFVEHRLGGYENSHVIGLIGGVDRWRYKRVISGYRTWHGESVYNEIVSVDGKWL